MFFFILLLIFCREFERTILNDSWLDAPQCRRTPRTHCDLTLDLGSDSDYGVRVRAECGQQVSPWARLSGLFNRRESESLRRRHGRALTGFTMP